MPPDGVELRLDKIEDAQRVALMESVKMRDRVDALIELVADLTAEIGGAPPRATRGSRLTIRDRLHQVSQVVSPLALDAAMEAYYTRKNASVWTDRQRHLVVLSAVISAVGVVLMLVRAVH